MYKLANLAYCLLVGSLCLSCQKPAKEQAAETPVVQPAEKTETVQEAPASLPISELSIPEGMTLLKEAKGDLDKDGIEEKVHIYDTEKEVEMGTERQVYIYKLENNSWNLWHKMTGAVLASRHGGVLGDPFEDLRIERGAIVIDHFGGSREKWNYTHRYRYQDNSWKLIGASSRFGAPCDYWEHFDYNLSTGNIVGSKETLNCDDESQNTTKSYDFKHRLDSLPDMEGYYPGETQIKSPQGDMTFYY